MIKIGKWKKSLSMILILTGILLGAALLTMSGNIDPWSLVDVEKAELGGEVTVTKAPLLKAKEVFLELDDRVELQNFDYVTTGRLSVRKIQISKNRTKLNCSYPVIAQLRGQLFDLQRHFRELSFPEATARKRNKKRVSKFLIERLKPDSSSRHSTSMSKVQVGNFFGPYYTTFKMSDGETIQQVLQNGNRFSFGNASPKTGIISVVLKPRLDKAARKEVSARQYQICQSLIAGAYLNLERHAAH